jgi:Fur family ferric uptake transcriptional regulator
MASAHPQAATPVETLDDALDVLQQRGRRLSAARRVILEVLFAADGPMTAEAIGAEIDGRPPRSDRASTYRNLETLQELGLVTHVHLGHGPGLYALAGAGEREYLVCDSCHDVRVMPPRQLDDVRALMLERFAFEARFDHFPVFGLCAACASDKRERVEDAA